jgi:hypothetical protein
MTERSFLNHGDSYDTEVHGDSLVTPCHRGSKFLKQPADGQRSTASFLQPFQTFCLIYGYSFLIKTF